MLARTADWLMARRDGNGGFLRNPKALDSFGHAPPEVTDAYITWALVSAGETGIDKELAKSAKLAETTQDAYLLALATGTLLQRDAGAAPSKPGSRRRRSWPHADTDGAWTKADHSITTQRRRQPADRDHLARGARAARGRGSRRRGAQGHRVAAAQRGGFGKWGATQATVLALKAMTTYDNVTRVAPQRAQ